MNHIIINPPYDGNLHLQILDKVIKTFPDAEIVNLSPIRWLQDPLAEYKKASDFKRFPKIREHIESLKKVENALANRIFSIAIASDLGIYRIKGSATSTFDVSTLRIKNPIIDKILAKASPSFQDKATGEGAEVDYKGIFGVINSHLGDLARFVSDSYELFCTPRETYVNKVVFFKTEEERRNCFDYLVSPLMRWYAINVKLNQRNPWQFVPYLDYTKKWDDTALREYFSITDEEWKEIEGTVKDN